jgi:hypothetical protein
MFDFRLLNLKYEIVIKAGHDSRCAVDPLVLFSWEFVDRVFPLKKTIHEITRNEPGYHEHTTADYSRNEFLLAIRSYMKIGITMLARTSVASCQGKA